MDPFGEPLFSSDVVKEEIVEEDQMRLVAGRDEGWPSKEEGVDTPVVKQEVEDGEEWEKGGCVKRGNTDFGEIPELKRRKWTPGTEASYVTQKELNSEVKKEVESPTSDQADDSLPFAKLASFNAHVLFSNEYENAVKKEEEEEGQNGAEERRNEADNPPRLMEPSRIHIGEAAFSFGHHLKSQQRIHEDRLQLDIPGQKTTAESAVERRNCLVDGCSEDFLSYADLVDHMKTHPNPVICGFCKKSFPYPSILRQHYPTHTGEKRFSCGFCYKRFAGRSTLKKHVQEGICTYRTYQQSALKSHRRTHKNEMIYSCTVCGFQTALQASLADHKKRFIH